MDSAADTAPIITSSSTTSMDDIASTTTVAAITAIKIEASAPIEIATTNDINNDDAMACVAAASSSSSSSSSSTAVRALPHAASYYAVPSHTHNALLPLYTDGDLALLAALPAESAGYASVLKHHLVNPRGLTTPLSTTTIVTTLSATPTTTTTAATIDDAKANASTSVDHDDDGNESTRKVQKTEHKQDNDAAISDASANVVDASTSSGTPASISVSSDASMLVDAAPALSSSSSSSSSSLSSVVLASDAASSSSSSSSAALSSINKKRARGQNKAGEREIFNARRDGNEVKLCRSTAAGVPCVFQSTCKYSHNLAAYVESRGADYVGPCVVFAKYGSCAAGASCKYSSEGHDAKYLPSVMPTPDRSTPILCEMNHLSKLVLGDLRACGIVGKRYEKRFPRTVSIMANHELWKSRYDAIRNIKQNQKQAAQKALIDAAKAKLVKARQDRIKAEAEDARRRKKEMKEMNNKKPIAAAAATTPISAQNGDVPMTTESSNDAAIAPVVSTSAPVDASLISVDITNASAHASSSSSSSSSLISSTPSSSSSSSSSSDAAASSSSSSSADPFSASSSSSSSSSAITISYVPADFPINSVETEIEIAALKSNYTHSFSSMPLDPLGILSSSSSSSSTVMPNPFAIVSEDYTDWSSGVILIDLDRRPFDFRNKLYLAPLTTVGNLPFRLTCLDYGADVTIGEMAMCGSLGKGQGSEWALLRRHAREKHFGVQIAGAFVDQISRACELISATCDVDFVDLNVGCPIDQVTSKGMGSALMQRKRMRNLEPMLRTMRSVLDCPATVKMRTGWAPGEMTCMELLPIAARCGMAAVTIHGRTRQQRYTKSADWSFITAAAKYSHDHLNDLPIIANGDVYTFEDYESIVTPDSHVATTMIARGALVKPWLFTEIKERRHWDISAVERLDMLRSFVAAGHEHFGTDTKGVETTRRYLLEWLSFTHRYIPVGLLEVVRVGIQEKTPKFFARSDLEQLLASGDCADWIRLSEMIIGPVPDGFKFIPKHKSGVSSEQT